MRLITDDGARTVRTAYALSCEGPHHVELVQSIEDTLWTAPPPGHAHHLGWWVDDVAAADAAPATGRGAEHLATIAMTDDAPPMCAYFRSTDGLCVEIVDRGFKKVLLPDAEVHDGDHERTSTGRPDDVGEIARGEHFYQRLLDDEVREVPVSLRATSAGFIEPIGPRTVALLRPGVPPARGRAGLGPHLADGVPRGADPRGRRLRRLRDRRLVAHRRPHRTRRDPGVSTTPASTAARSCAPAGSGQELPLPVPRVHLEPRRHAGGDPGRVGLPARRPGRRSACPRRRSARGAGSCS